jgi:hypothetical protein
MFFLRISARCSLLIVLPKSCHAVRAGQEDNEDDVSDFEAEFIAAEPDTENENEMVC